MRNKESVKIDGVILESVREYCKANRLKYSGFIENAILEKLERGEK